MLLNLNISPSQEPLSLEEVKTFLKTTTSLEDAFLKTLISGARSYVEGVTGRSLLLQLWIMEVKPPYPSSSPLVRSKEKSLEIRIPRPPLLEIESVLGEDKPIEYKLEGPKIILSPLHWNKKITVSFWSGYGEDPASLPSDLKLSVLMATRSFYENKKPDIPCLQHYKMLHLI